MFGFLLTCVICFITYKILIKRYNAKKRPYLIEDQALKLVNGADKDLLKEALSVVYKKKKNYKICSKFNKILAKEIYFIQNENMKDEVKKI